MKHRAVLIVIVIFILLLVGAYFLYGKLRQDIDSDQLSVQSSASAQDKENGQQEETTDSSEKVQLPDFTVYDLEGNEVQLSDFRGKPVVLNFWASWCGPCQSEMPDFDAAYDSLGEEVQFLMVNMTDGSRETVEKASQFIADRGYTFPVFYDTDSSAATAYGIYSLPTTLFIDAEGYGVAQATGAIDEKTLQKGIDMIR